MKTLIDAIIVLAPFVLLFAGFLVFRWGSLKTCLYTMLFEFIVVWTYYRTAPVHSFEAAIWGNVVIWSGTVLIWAGQIFGYIYKKTGLMKVLLDSVESIFPEENREGRAITLLSPLSALLTNLHGMAAYPLVVPGLVELGFDKISAASATLVYMSWSLGFGGLFIGAIIANAATHIPIVQIAQAAGIFGIPLVLTCTYSAFDLLGYSFWKRETQMLFWIVSLSYIISLVLFTQIWPALYLLSLFVGAGLALAGLAVYGGFQKRAAAVTSPLRAALAGGAGTISIPGASLFAANTSALPASATPGGNSGGSARTKYPWSVVARAYGPILVAIVYVLFELSPAGAHFLSHLQFRFGAWGYAPISINIFTAPAFVILLAALSCYLFEVKHEGNPVSDIATGTAHSRSSLATMVVSSAVMFLMSDTGQLSFLGNLLAKCGSIGYQLLDALVVVLGGTIFGAGTPSVFAFAQMQLPAAAKLGLPVVLLVGLVTLGALGCTNGLKPPNLRFVASLVDLGAEADNQIFRKGLKWSIVQAIVLTLTLLVVAPFWHH